jgi:opacity protein-like surface antigen
MILRSLRFLTAGVLFAFAASAHAQAPDPKLWYVAGGGGASFYQDMTFTGAVAGDIHMDTGYTGNVAVGRYLDDVRVLRLELEGVYASADMNSSAGFQIGGDISNGSLMVNFLYDFHTGSPWVPFVGGGIGHSWVTINNLSNSAGTTLVNDSASVFAYQFKTGVAYQFNPALAATLTYRYFATNDPAFETTTPGITKSDGIRSHNAEFGVRFNF